jgi:hypothetical protein
LDWRETLPEHLRVKGNDSVRMKEGGARFQSP